MRSGGNSGSATTGVQKSAPTSNRSFCTVVSTRDHVVVEAADGERHADVGVGLVDVGVGLQPQVVLGGDAHVAETGLAGVAGAGVDAGEVDHAPSLGRGPTGPALASAGCRDSRSGSEGPLVAPAAGHGPRRRGQEQRAEADGRRPAGPRPDG